MDHVDLPILPEETTLAAAGEAMASHERRAVVTRRHGALVVLTADDMHAAVVRHRSAALTLADIHPSKRPLTHFGDQASRGHEHSIAAHEHATKGHPRSAEQHGHGEARHAGAPHEPALSAVAAGNTALQQAFDEQPEAEVTVLQRTAELARVATRHEGIAEPMRLPRGTVTTRGVCRAPSRDTWWWFELVSPGVCNFDNEVVDFK